MIVVAHGSAGLQPRRLGLWPPGAEIYLDKFDCAGHSSIWMTTNHCTMRIRQTAMAGAQPLGGRTGIYACISGFARVAQPPSAVRFSCVPSMFNSSKVKVLFTT